MDYRARRLNQYVQGWMGYFRLAHTPGSSPTWTNGIAVGCDRSGGRNETAADAGGESACPRVRADLAWQWGMSSRGYWRIAKSPILHRALPTSYWQERGVVFFHPAWARFRTT